MKSAVQEKTLKIVLSVLMASKCLLASEIPTFSCCSHDHTDFVQGLQCLLCTYSLNSVYVMKTYLVIDIILHNRFPF